MYVFSVLILWIFKFCQCFFSAITVKKREWRLKKSIRVTFILSSKPLSFFFSFTTVYHHPCSQVAVNTHTINTYIVEYLTETAHILVPSFICKMKLYNLYNFLFLTNQFMNVYAYWVLSVTYEQGLHTCNVWTGHTGYYGQMNFCAMMKKTNIHLIVWNLFIHYILFWFVSSMF